MRYPQELHSVSFDMELFYRKLVPAGAKRTLNVERMTKGFALTALLAHVEDILQITLGQLPSSGELV
jgi:hypothetical protein